MAGQPLTHRSGVPDTNGSIAHILDTIPVLSAANTFLLSVRNNGTEYVSVDKVGKTILGGTPGAYTPTGGLVVNTSLIQLGDGTSQIGLDLKSGSAGAYISDASVFWQYFLKSPSRVEWPVKHVYQNNVGIIETSQASGAAGGGQPGFLIKALNSLAGADDRLLQLQNANSEKFLVMFDGALKGPNNEALVLKSREDDGATAVAFTLNTDNALSTAGAKLWSLQNNSSEKASIDKDGNATVGELKIKLYSQAAEPALSADDYLALWKDTDDSNRIYLVFRRGTGDQVKVELT